MSKVRKLPSEQCVREERVGAFMTLIRARFQESEFNSRQFSEGTGVPLVIAQRDLLRLANCGFLERRREGSSSKGGWQWIYSLPGAQRGSVVHWRAKDSAALPDCDLEKIARGVVKRILSKLPLHYDLDYDELLSAALETAFRDHKEFRREGVKVATAWQATIIWNKCYCKVFESVKAQLRNRRIYNRVDVKFMASRGRVFEEMQRAEVVDSLYNAVMDAGIEAAPQYLFTEYFALLKNGDSTKKYRYKTARLAYLIGKELFGDLDNYEWDELKLDERDKAALNGSLEHNTRSALNSAKDVARRRAYGELVKQCLNGDRELPKRDLKNLRLLRQLEEAGF